MAAEYDAKKIVELIKKRYENKNRNYNEYVVLEQVADGTGYDQSRWIDVAVFAMWPMRGLTRAAFEIKVTRQDFLRELSMPLKHQWCKEAFHEFWFVAPKDIIQVEELPVNSGFMYPRGDSLCVGRHAVRNETPKLDDSLLAAFLRAAYKRISEAQKTNEADVLEKSYSHKIAKAHQEAVQSFIRLKTGRDPIHMIEQEEILRELQSATADIGLLKDQKLLLNISERFQVRVAELLRVFIEIAHIGILARDDMGKSIVEAWGGDDQASLEALRQLMKSKKPGVYGKHQAELIDLISRWGAEDPGP